MVPSSDARRRREGIRAARALRVEELPSSPRDRGPCAFACTSGRPGLLLLANRYQISAALPFTPGSELAGEVIECGPGVSGLAVGDRVYGALLVGAFAEEAVLPATALSRIPAGVDFGAAAAFGVAYTTAFGALVSAAALRAGETLLVLGAAGGVGLAAVELGRVLGARVIAAASSEEKRELCLAKGAAAAIDGSPEGLRERVREAAGTAGVNVVLDPVGGGASEPALRSLAQAGRHVVVGFAAGEIPRIAANLLLLRNARLVGFELGGWRRHQAEAAREADQTLRAWLAAGRIAPHVGGRFPLEGATEALRRVAERRALGKLLIEPRPRQRPPSRRFVNMPPSRCLREQEVLHTRPFSPVFILVRDPGARRRRRGARCAHLQGR
jgi:NADPH2:quinone reductase